MINSKITKQVAQQSNEERLFKLLESIDWKLWEMYNIIKDTVPASDKTTKAAAKTTTKTKKSAE